MNTLKSFSYFCIEKSEKIFRSEKKESKHSATNEEIKFKIP